MSPADAQRAVDDVRLLMARVQRLQREMNQAAGQLAATVAVLQQHEAAMGRTDR